MRIQKKIIFFIFVFLFLSGIWFSNAEILEQFPNDMNLTANCTYNGNQTWYNRYTRPGYDWAKIINQTYSYYRFQPTTTDTLGIYTIIEDCNATDIRYGNFTFTCKNLDSTKDHTYQSMDLFYLCVHSVENRGFCFRLNGGSGSFTNALTPAQHYTPHDIRNLGDDSDYCSGADWETHTIDFNTFGLADKLWAVNSQNFTRFSLLTKLYPRAGEVSKTNQITNISFSGIPLGFIPDFEILGDRVLSMDYPVFDYEYNLLQSCEGCYLKYAWGDFISKYELTYVFETFQGEWHWDRWYPNDFFNSEYYGGYSIQTEITEAQYWADYYKNYLGFLGYFIPNLWTQNQRIGCDAIDCYLENYNNSVWEMKFPAGNNTKTWGSFEIDIFANTILEIDILRPPYGFFDTITIQRNLSSVMIYNQNYTTGDIITINVTNSTNLNMQFTPEFWRINPMGTDTIFEYPRINTTATASGIVFFTYRGFWKMADFQIMQNITQFSPDWSDIPNPIPPFSHIGNYSYRFYLSRNSTLPYYKYSDVYLSVLSSADFLDYITPLENFTKESPGGYNASVELSEFLDGTKSLVYTLCGLGNDLYTGFSNGESPDFDFCGFMELLIYLSTFVLALGTASLFILISVSLALPIFMISHGIYILLLSWFFDFSTTQIIITSFIFTIGIILLIINIFSHRGGNQNG